MEIPCDVAEVWAALEEIDGWLADWGSLDLEPGASGLVVEDGSIRHVTVEAVERYHRLVFRWWPADATGSPRHLAGVAGGEPSRVEVTLEPGAGATIVTVRETLLPAGLDSGGKSGARASADARARSALWWELRLTCLAFAARTARVAV